MCPQLLCGECRCVPSWCVKNVDVSPARCVPIPMCPQLMCEEYRCNPSPLRPHPDVSQYRYARVLKFPVNRIVIQRLNQRDTTGWGHIGMETHRDIDTTYWDGDTVIGMGTQRDGSTSGWGHIAGMPRWSQPMTSAPARRGSLVSLPVSFGWTLGTWRSSPRGTATVALW